MRNRPNTFSFGQLTQQAKRDLIEARQHLENLIDEHGEPRSPQSVGLWTLECLNAIAKATWAVERLRFMAKATQSAANQSEGGK